MPCNAGMADARPAGAVRVQDRQGSLVTHLLLLRVRVKHSSESEVQKFALIVDEPARSQVRAGRHCTWPISIRAGRSTGRSPEIDIFWDSEDCLVVTRLYSERLTGTADWLRSQEHLDSAQSHGACTHITNPSSYSDQIRHILFYSILFCKLRFAGDRSDDWC